MSNKEKLTKWIADNYCYYYSKGWLNNLDTGSSNPKFLSHKELLIKFNEYLTS